MCLWIHVKQTETKQRGLVELAGFEVRNKWVKNVLSESSSWKKTFNMMEICCFQTLENFNSLKWWFTKMMGRSQKCAKLVVMMDHMSGLRLYLRYTGVLKLNPPPLRSETANSWDFLLNFYKISGILKFPS